MEDYVLTVMATGSGKTEIFLNLLDGTTARACVLLNNTRLVEQTARRHGDCGVYCAELKMRDTSNRVTVASVQSIYARADYEPFKLIIVDEAHNLNDGMYSAFLGANPGAKVLGFTATPWRNNAPIYGDGERFSRIHFRRSLDFMMDDGYVVRPVLKCGKHNFDTRGLKTSMGDFLIKDIEKMTSDKGRVELQIQDAMPRLTMRKKIVWVCSSIEHAETVRELIPEKSCIMHSKHPHNDYHKQLFETGDVRHMVSVMMISEGYDFPAIDAIVLMRPTRSIKLYVQVCGRALRPVYKPGAPLHTAEDRLNAIAASEKENALILDYGEVVQNCGPLNAPNEARPKGDKEPLKNTLWLCYECMTYNPASSEVCKECDAPKPGAESAREVGAKSLVAYEGNILKTSLQSKRYNVERVEVSAYTSKKGNPCIRVDYDVGNRWPVSEFFSNHPVSWAKGRERLAALSDGAWVFVSFDEALEWFAEPREGACASVEVVADGPYDRVVGVKI